MTDELLFVNFRIQNGSIDSRSNCSKLLLGLSGIYTVVQYDQFHFYRAMHFSAKRGIAIACRLSVCL